MDFTESKYISCEKGYIDPAIPLIMMGLAGIFAPIFLLAEKSGFSLSAVTITVLPVALSFQMFLLIYTFGEVKHSAYCYSRGTNRGGLNRAPAIEGAAWPVVIMVIYAVGAGVGWWKSAPGLLSIFYLLMIFVALLLWILADNKGVKMAEAEKTGEEESV